MKDKLRELAELVREAYRAGFIAACKWPAPVTQDVDSSAYNKEFSAWSFSVREKHAAILDDEGDGGEVASGVNPDELYAQLAPFADPACRDCDGRGVFYGNVCVCGCVMTKLQATHPARSGVVSDEDVEEALKIWNDAPALGRDEDDAYAMRAALEHFAKLHQEKQS